MGSRLDIPPVCANLLKYQLSGCMGVQTLQSGQLLSGLVDQEADHAAVVRCYAAGARQHSKALTASIRAVGVWRYCVVPAVWRGTRTADQLHAHDKLLQTTQTKDDSDLFVLPRSFCTGRSILNQ